MSSNCYYCGGHPDEVIDLRLRRDELEALVDRQQADRNNLHKSLHMILVANEGDDTPQGRRVRELALKALT